MLTGRPEGECGLYTGSSRMGKTASLKQRIKAHKRVIVWSVKETIDGYGQLWSGTIYIKTLSQLRDIIRKRGKAKTLRIVYMPASLKEFEGWAKAAHALGIIAPCSVVAEELADVTSPAKAPDGWGNLIRQGLGWGINIYGLSQRPAESDKTICGNATFLHAHYMQRLKDRQSMAAEMGIPVLMLAKLKKLEWLEAWPGGEIKRGKLKF